MEDTLGGTIIRTIRELLNSLNPYSNGTLSDTSCMLVGEA